jgi:predicted small integral membrane protein
VPRRPSHLLALCTLPISAAVMTVLVALYLVLVTFGNITDFGTNLAFVQHVLAMDTTFHDPDLMWRSITSPVAQHVAYLAVISWEALTSAVLVWAAVLWSLALRHGSFGRARGAATLGYLMALALWVGGFLAIGGEWFAMWQSKQWNGLAPALQNTVVTSIGLVLTQLPSREWDAADQAG